MKRFGRKKELGLAALVLLGILAWTGCGGPSPSGTADDPNGDGPAGGAGRVMYQLGGSDSEVNVVQRLTEVFSGENPDITFAVTGGGSGSGIASLIDGQLDVANSSRPMRDQEISDARANGVDPRPFVFAQDGLAVVINADNPVDALTVEEIGAIFAGDITNWSAVGGADAPISLYGRQSTSGTYVYFMENVVKGDYSEQKKMQSGNAAIVEGVIAEEHAIGYIAVGYAVDGGAVVAGLKVLEVAPDAASPAASPLDLANIMEERYPIVRPLFHYVDGRPEGGLAQYLEFVISERGQEIVQAEGFFPITNAHRALNEEVYK